MSFVTDSELQTRVKAESDKIVSLVLWALRDARATDRIMSSFRVWAPVIGELSQSVTGRDALIAVIGYLMRAKAELTREQIEMIVSEAAPEAKETYMTLAEQLEERGLQRGLEKGLEKGRSEGLEKGRSEGQRALVARLLSLKFGTLSEPSAQRLDRASDANLQLWAERVLTAATLEDVFR